MARYKFSYIYIFFTLLLFLNCKKEKAALDNLGIRNLSVSVGGIEEVKSLMASASTETNTHVEESEYLQVTNSIHYTTSLEISNNRKLNWKNELSKDGITTRSKIASNQVDNNIITYRFVLFAKSGNKYNYIGYKDGTNGKLGDALSFEVPSGNSYKWVAYSYNENTPITDSINSLSYSIKTAIDKDLLYDSGTIEPSNEDQSIKIRFKHRLARMAITLNAESFVGLIESSKNNKETSTDLVDDVQVKLYGNSEKYFKVGDFDLLNNIISNISSQIYSENLKFETLSNGYIKIAYLYTADIGSKIENLTLRVDDLMLKDTLTYRAGNYPIISGKDITIKSKDIVLQEGYSYSPTVTFRPATEGVIKGKIMWARGNLTYDPQTKTFRIRNSPYASDVTAENDYWMFNSISPWDSHITEKVGQNVRIWEDSKDPCRQVPGGWRLPTEAEGLLLGGKDVDPNNRLQAPNWDSRNKVTWGTNNLYVNIPQNTYTSFKGDNNEWVTFFKSALIDVTSDYNRNVSVWKLIVEDALFIPVIEDGVVQSYAVLQIDGEDNYFKDNTLDKFEKIPIRCVRDIP